MQSTCSSSNADPKSSCQKVNSGYSTLGEKYKSMEEMWRKKTKGDLYDPEKGWYGRSIKYWANVSADMDGVLGGMTFANECDLKESKEFIESLPNRQSKRALDCAAGIGRITKSLLVKMYETTDLLEALPHMLEQAKIELAGLPVGEFFLSSMEEAELKPKHYDLVVIQWAAIYLTDADFIKFFRMCGDALTDGGYIFFKENCIKSGSFVVDEQDSSVLRTDDQYAALFKEAGLTVVKAQYQKDWPQELFPVKMFALR